MAAWVLVPSLVTLRGEFNAVAPDRDKTSDGSIGDTAHQAEVSDHNPDETGSVPIHDADTTNEVHAIDVDMTGPWPAGWSMERIVQFLLAECRAGREKRLRYIIYDRRIWAASSGWVRQDYTGANPHDHHAHFSASYTTALEADTSPYGLVTAVGDDMPLDTTDIARVRATVKDLLVSDPDVKLQLAARPWQYAGGGLPPGSTGTLQAFTEGVVNTRELLRLVKAGLPADQLASFATTVSKALVGPLVNAIVVQLEGVEPVDLPRLQSVVEAGVRNVLLSGVATTP